MTGTRASDWPARDEFLTCRVPFRFAYLGSGSRGNSALVRVRDTCIMLDCGFSIRETERRLQRLATEPSEISAILVTHEHSDHISGVGRFARRHDIPVWMTPGTRAAMGDSNLPVTRDINCHDLITIGHLHVEPVPVPHDAREPCQFFFSDGSKRLGIITDTGHITRHLRRRVDGLDALAIECNHDRHSLANGPYPLALKDRIGGSLGHLSNDQTSNLLENMDRSRLRHVVAVHLSETNNSPARARQALTSSGVAETHVRVANQVLGLDWIDV